jgi:hypothetical protein
MGRTLLRPIGPCFLGPLLLALAAAAPLSAQTTVTLRISSRRASSSRPSARVYEAGPSRPGT